MGGGNLARALYGGVSLLLAVAIAAPADGGEEVCGKCKPKKAAWPWKANGYAVGADAAAIEKVAESAATESACAQASRYLEAQKLTCAAGCEPGALVEGCEPSKKPLCTSGDGTKNAGMWKFVCQKARGDASACDDEARAASPHYAMCDVSVAAEKVLPCGDPACGS